MTGRIRRARHRVAVGCMLASLTAWWAVPSVADAQGTIRVETVPASDSLPRRSPFDVAAPNMQAASRLVGCYAVTPGTWVNAREGDNRIPMPARIELTSERHRRIYIGFGLMARTPQFAAQRDSFPPAWSPIGADSLQLRAWADGSSSVMLFLRRQSDRELRGTARYFFDALAVDSTGRWRWESYPAAPVSLTLEQCEPGAR